jgi:hypothetical protein
MEALDRHVPCILPHLPPPLLLDIYFSYAEYKFYNIKFYFLLKLHPYDIVTKRDIYEDWVITP